MSDGYRVVDKDGKEHGPISLLEIGRMYAEGRLTRDSYIYEQRIGGWRRMEDVVDMTTIEKLRDKMEGAGQSAPEQTQSKPAPTFTPTILGVNTPGSDEPRTSGMVAAAVLLLINAAIAGLGYLFLASEGIRVSGNIAVTAPFWDVIVAVGLLRGKDAWKKWGMVRAVIGAVAFGLISPLAAQTIGAAVQGVYQIVFSAGIIALLYGKPPSRARVVIGSIAVVLAWFGFAGGSIIDPLISEYKMQNEIEKQALPISRFVDEATGVSLDLPEGWRLLSSDNTIVPAPDASLIAVNLNSGCFTTLMTLDLPEEVDFIGSPDDYLNLLQESRQEEVPSMKNLSRSDIQLGNMNGRRQLTEWKEGGQLFRGFNSVCKSGNIYYLLTGWCASEAYAEAFKDFVALEKSLNITAPISGNAEKGGSPNPVNTGPPPPAKQ